MPRARKPTWTRSSVSAPSWATTFPLLIGAGLTASNVHEQLEATDGAIVGSFLKDTHVDTGRISAAHVELLMREVHSVRALAGTANGKAVR